MLASTWPVLDTAGLDLIITSANVYLDCCSGDGSGQAATTQLSWLPLVIRNLPPALLRKGERERLIGVLLSSEEDREGDPGTPQGFTQYGLVARPE